MQVPWAPTARWLPDRWTHCGFFLAGACSATAGKTDKGSNQGARQDTAPTGSQAREPGSMAGSPQLGAPKAFSTLQKKSVLGNAEQSKKSDPGLPSACPPSLSSPSGATRFDKINLTGSYFTFWWRKAPCNFAKGYQLFSRSEERQHLFTGCGAWICNSQEENRRCSFHVSSSLY